MSLPAPLPDKTRANLGGIFQYLVQINGSDAQVKQAQAKLAQLTPTTAAVYAALNILPEGELKSWLTANPVQFWKKIIALVKGRKWTAGDYVLGERLNDQIYCNSGIGRQQVSDEMVDLAHVIFNQLFGVRITTAEDLDSLDNGVGGYRTRAASTGIGTDAIERAVFLKRNYFPSSTYNTKCWDLRYFEIYPLVDRIPGYEIGKWYTGSVIGGSYAVDGVIPISATDILDQYLGADFDPITGNVKLPDGTILTPGGAGSMLDTIVNFAKANPLVVAGAAAAAGWLYNEAEENGWL